MRSKSVCIVFLALLIVGSAQMAFAVSPYLGLFENQYKAAVGSKLDNCTLCHKSTAGAAARNPYGTAFGANGHNFTAIEPLDSNGDGANNITEINALTFPGDKLDVPATVPAPGQAFPGGADPIDNFANWVTMVPPGGWVLDTNLFASASSSMKPKGPGNKIAVFSAATPFVDFSTGSIEANVRVSGKRSNVAIIFSYQNKKAYRYARLLGKKLIIGQVGKVGADKPGIKASVAINPAVPPDFVAMTVNVANTGMVTVNVNDLAGAPIVSAQGGFGTAIPGKVGVSGAKTVNVDDFLVTPVP